MILSQSRAPASLRRLARRFAILALRYTPVSWRIKRWTIWYLSTRFGVGVHAVITDADGRILTLLSAYSGRWQLPGGALEYGETIEEGVRREVEEEVGMAPVRVELVELRLDVASRGIEASFRVELPDAAIRLSEEHTAWRYASPDELPPFYRRCAEAVLAAALSDRGGGS